MRWSFRKSTVCKVDIHSHLIPGIDDGSPTLQASVEMIELLQKQGFQKLITTPHIHPKFPNSEEGILEGLDRLKEHLHSIGNSIEIEVAAEYYVDDMFLERSRNQDKFLSFGDGYVLIECSFFSKPLFFDSAVYRLQELGYKPVFAHPERYKFVEGNIDWLKQLKDIGVLMQVTVGSVAGYYGEGPKAMAIELIKRDMVDFLGSDLHRSSQIEFLQKGSKSRYVRGLVDSGKLLNDQLL